MSSFIAYTLFGLFSGAAYAIAASGLVLTYSDHAGLQHRPRRLRDAAVLRLLGLQRPAGDADLLALGLVLFVVAPAIGWFIARFVARDLGDAPASVSLVVTVALLVALHRRRHAGLPAGVAHGPAVLRRHDVQHRRRRRSPPTR